MKKFYFSIMYVVSQLTYISCFLYIYLAAAAAKKAEAAKAAAAKKEEAGEYQ